MDSEQQTKIEKMANSMGIAYYEQLSEKEAAKFLGISVNELERIRQSGLVSYLQVTTDKVSFFAFQLLEYLSNRIVSCSNTTNTKTGYNQDRILRIKEVVKITGLSRSTIWRMEKKEDGSFPERVSLGVGSVGWRASDIEAWVKSQ